MKSAVKAQNGHVLIKQVNEELVNCKSVLVLSQLVEIKRECFSSDLH